MRYLLSSMLFILLVLTGFTAGCASTKLPSTATPGPDLASVLQSLPEDNYVDPGAIVTVVVTATNDPLGQEDDNATQRAPQASASPESTPTGQLETPTSEVLTSEAKVRPLLSTINIRKGPGTSFDIIGFLSDDVDTTVLAKDRTSTWYNILTESGVRGWVAANVVEIVAGESSLIEVAATIPTLPTQTYTPTRATVLTATPDSVPGPSKPSNTPTVNPVPTDNPLPTDYPYPAPPTVPPTVNPYP
jgi:hypothetical protein